MTDIPLNTHCIRAEYAVRGGIPTLADEIASHREEYPHIKRITRCNIGNPQLLGQPPLTFFRDTLSLCVNPRLIRETDGDGSTFSDESRRRAMEILASNGGAGIGCYTDSQGNACVRRHVARYIEKRDGLTKGSIDVSQVFLTDGASPGVKLTLQLLLDSSDPASTGYMCSIPQYPLYSATIATLGAKVVPYYLREESGWSIDTHELLTDLTSAHERGITVKAICVINPGNPTGTVLAPETLTEIIRFADENSLVIMADEVYQENVYAPDKKFVSFQSALKDYERQYPSRAGRIPLVSFHSISKGLYGECGFRGGYFVLTNIGEQTHKVFRKMASINLCPNTSGQVLMSCMVKPPKLGTAARAQHDQERDEIMKSLQIRAKMVSERCQGLPGLLCQPVEGSLYAFPRVMLSKRAIEKAKEEGDPSPDYFYCKRLLLTTGIVMVPGSGFGEEEGTFHFRTTILPPIERFDEFMTDFEEFHRNFREEFKD